MKKFSPYYYEIIKKYQLFHINGTEKLPPSKTFMGYSLTKWVGKIKEIINLNNCKSILDFGCGKAFLYTNSLNINNINYKNITEFWNVKDVYLYDPGVVKFSTYPNKKYDGVICTDVIEHIPENDIMNFIQDIFDLSEKFVFIVVALMPASKQFDDGKNIHLCLKSKNEWDKIFNEFKKMYPSIKQYIYFNE